MLAENLSSMNAADKISKRRIRDLESDFKEHEVLGLKSLNSIEVLKQRIVDLEGVNSKLHSEHEHRNQEIDLELSELYEFVEQQKEAGDRYLAERDGCKQEAKILQAKIVLVRYSYFAQVLMLKHDILTQECDNMPADPAEVRENSVASILQDSGQPQKPTDLSTSHGTTFGPEGFEALPLLQLSSRKLTKR
jgi:hypothetical protein